MEAGPPRERMRRMDAKQNLAQFMAAVSRNTDAQIAQAAAQAQEEAEQLLNDAAARAAADAEREIETAKRRIDAKYQKRMSQVGYRGRTALLSRRQSLLMGLFGELQQKLNDFTASDGYLPWMESLLKQAAPPEGAVILLRRADLAMQDALRSAAGVPCSFRADPAIRMGGLSVLSPDGRRCENHTLDEAFSEQLRGFYRNHSIDGGDE